MSDQFQRFHAEHRPLNDNERAFISDIRYIKGGAQPFLSIDELVAFHPDRMKQGMTALIMNYPTIGNISEYYLSLDPSELLDSSNETIVTSENFTDYWQLKFVRDKGSARVFNYAPNKSGGGKPSYPYTPTTESSDNWSAVFDESKGHKWVRWRTDDIDANSDGVFDNWTVPISIAQAFTEGDYVENRFIRQDVNLTIRSSSTGLENGKYYIVLSGSVDVESVNYSQGKTFQHVTGNSYTFNSATVQESLKVPPFVKADGTLNNEPTGYSDTPPVGSALLWMIEAQKSVYGQLKSEWRLKRIVEDPNYVRYSNSPTPLPSTLCGINDSAASGTARDTALTDAGWVATFVNQSYIAIREDDNSGSAGPPFTAWRVEKINEESGEYTDHVYKLFDANLDPDSPLIVKPTIADAIEEGYFDTPQPLTSTQINYQFSARKFFNGELKTAWSDGIPWNGESVYNAEINSIQDNSFKIDVNNDNATVPTEIELIGQLFKGIDKLWEKDDVTLSFSWKKIYDDGSVVDVDSTSSTSEDFYHKGSSGTQGTSGYYWDAQILVVKPDAVTGKAVFQLTVTLSMDTGDDLVFTSEFGIVDVTDGKDAKDLSVRADNQRTVYDTDNTVFVPDTVRLKAYNSNLGSPTYYWYRWDGSEWDALSTGGAYTVSGSSLIIDSSSLFAANGNAEEERIAVSTDSSDPDDANFNTTFSDYITIVKQGSAGIGSPGVDAVAALLDNESSTMVLDRDTNLPISGETGSSGRNVTKLEIWDGNTKKVYGGGNDYTVAVSPSSGDIQFAVVADGNDAKIYISSWTSTTARSATCTITITYGAITLIKKFQVSTTLDAPGAIILTVDSNKGFQFSASDRDDKTLTANLYDTNKDPQLQTSGYQYRFRVAGSWSSWSTTRTKTITRANVKVSEDITVQARVTGETDVLREATIRIVDILDAQIIRMMTDSASVTSANKIPSTHIDSSNVTVSGVTWRSVYSTYWDTNTPTYGIEGEEDPTDITKFKWSNPYQIKGEKGDQGGNGDFYFKMYKQNGTTLPSSTATLAQMTSAGWVSPEERTNVDNLYETERRWNGEGVTFTDGYPDTDPTTGSSWSAPVQISGDVGSDGDDGDDGLDGDNGWAPVLAVVSDGERRVHRLTDWIGGEGTKPGNIGKYLSSGGFVTSIGSATDIRGAEGPAGDNGVAEGIDKYWFKYLEAGIPSEGSQFTNQIDTGDSNSKSLIIKINIIVNSGNSNDALFVYIYSRITSGGNNTFLKSQGLYAARENKPTSCNWNLYITVPNRYLRVVVTPHHDMEIKSVLVEAIDPS